MEIFDYLVVGGGVVGTSIARELGSCGKKVVLCVIGIFLLLFHPFIPKTLNSFLTTARINLINKCDPYKFVNDISKNTHLKT